MMIMVVKKNHGDSERGKSLLFSICIVVCLIFCKQAAAGCNGTTGLSTWDFGTITVPVNDTSSQYGSSNTYTTITVPTDITCTTSPITLIATLPNPAPTNVNRQTVFLDTGQWSGLSVALGYADRGTIYVDFNFPGTNTYQSATFGGPGTGDGVVVGYALYRENAPLQAGSVNMHLSGVVKTDDGYSVQDINIKGKINESSCDVNTAMTPTSVSLGTVYSNSLPEVGTTSNPTGFKIVLNCNNNVSVNLTLNGTEDPAAQGRGVLAIDTGGGAASGVGVQLLFNDEPVLLGSTLSIGRSTTGEFDIPLVAQYYKTKDKLDTGSVNATATYTLTYL